MKKNERLAHGGRHDYYSKSYKKKCFLTTLCLFFISIGTAFASDNVKLSENAMYLTDQTNQQSMTVTGTVKDDLGDPLPGVTVVLKSDKKMGVSTDMKW